MENTAFIQIVAGLPVGSACGALLSHLGRQLVLHARRPVLVNFYSDSCPPCRQLAPTIERVAQDYKKSVVIYSVRIEDVPSLVVRYRVEAVPTMIFFRNGREAERMIGPQDRDAYLRALGRLLITDRMV